MGYGSKGVELSANYGLFFMKSKSLHMVSWILLIVGGVNWGLIGLGGLVSGAGWNVVNMVFGSMPVIEGLVYVLVGLAAVYEVVTHKAMCKVCGTSGMAM
jgi:hypothetical protein